MQPEIVEELDRLADISIHAPYKGCNLREGKVNGAFIISIHAPYKGCNTNILLMNEDDFISIHAPYKGCNIKMRVVFKRL